MITIYGRMEDRFAYHRERPSLELDTVEVDRPFGQSTIKAWRTENNGLAVTGQTLGEVLACFCELRNVKVIPHTPPKYFRYFEPGSDEQWHLVDIHISRGGDKLRPKQDLNFPLRDGDIVEILQLVG